MSGEKATKIRKDDVEKVRAARVNAAIRDLERQGMVLEKIGVSELSDGEMTTLIKTIERNDITLRELLREIIARRRSGTNARPEPKRNVPDERTYKYTLAKDKGKECKACKGLGYRTIYSTDPKAPFNQYTYGKCPDCGGSGRR